MKKGMILITAVLFACFAISLPAFILTENGILETVTVSLGITLYHFVMRLFVGYTVNAIMKNKANYNNAWFREKGFEKGLYKLLRVRLWKKHLPTFSPETFDTEKKTVEELIGATCQAETVHEIIMILSLLPIALIPLLGGAASIIITSVISMLFDSLFVVIQRYNRPMLIRVMKRFLRIHK